MHGVPPAAVDDTDVLGLLERVTAALASPLEPGEMLEVLARIGREAVAADRSSLLLLQDDRLVPAAAPVIEANDALVAVLRQTPGGDRAAALAAGRAAVIGATIVAVPLVAQDQPVGVLVLEWDEPRTFDAAELRLLETILAYAGMSMTNARLFAAVRRRAELQVALVRAGASLAGPLTPSAIADRLTDTYTDLLRPRLAAVALLAAAPCLATSVTTRGPRPVRRPVALSSLPDALVQRVAARWAEQLCPIDVGHDAAL